MGLRPVLNIMPKTEKAKGVWPKWQRQLITMLSVYVSGLTPSECACLIKEIAVV